MTELGYGRIGVEDLVKRVRGYGADVQAFVDEYIGLEDPLAAYFPFTDSGDKQEIEFWMRQGRAGVMGVARSARIPPTKSVLRRFQQEMDVDKYAYLLTNEVLEKTIDNLDTDDAFDANTFFAEAQLWKRLSALKAGAGKQITASGTWNTTDAEANIAEAVAWLKDYGWKKGWGKILCIYPARVDMGVNQARAFRGGYDTVAGIIKQSYPEVEFISYSPFRGANDELVIDILGGTSSDALGTSALLTVAQPTRILECKSYSFKRTPSVFVEQISDVGYLTILHRMNACRVKPWKSASDSATTNPLIVEITGVAPAR